MKVQAHSAEALAAVEQQLHQQQQHKITKKL